MPQHIVFFHDIWRSGALDYITQFLRTEQKLPYMVAPSTSELVSAGSEGVLLALIE
jgi:hypothetical protein